MTKKLTHDINMEQFINQIALEHDLIDELVTNAIEAATSWVKIIHSGRGLIVWNNGKSLDVEAIQKTLLTAFETGEEKNLETNRGLGFISLYKHSKRATINTGRNEVEITAWDDIKSSEADFVEGFRIEIELADEFLNLYSYSSVKKQLDHWIYWENIEILFGTDEDKLSEIGRRLDNPPRLLNHSKYKYQNLRYTFDDFGYDQRVVFLYKLTNVQGYRKLAIDFDIDQLFPDNDLEKITFAISHGAYLDSTRRSLTKWGRNQVEELLRLIVSDIDNDNLRRITFKIKREFIQRLEQILTQLKQDFDFLSIEEITKKIDEQMKNHPSIIKQGTYVDKLLLLLSYTEIKGLNPFLPELYHNYPEFLRKYQEEITEEEFHTWIHTVFETKTATFFEHSIVGFRLTFGEISGQITIGELLKEKLSVVRFDDRLFRSAVIDKVEIGVLLHQESGYFANLSDQQTDLESLVSHLGKNRPITDMFNVFEIYNEKTEKISDTNEKSWGIINGIPYLNHSDQQLSEDILSIIREAGKCYFIWREAIKVCLESYQQPPHPLIPVVIIPEIETKLACFIHGFIGISLNLLTKLTEENSRIMLLYAAIHEVTHVFCRTHGNKFYQISAEIYENLLSSDLLEFYLETKVQ